MPKPIEPAVSSRRGKAAGRNRQKRSLISASDRLPSAIATPALSALHQRSVALQLLCAGREVLVVGRGVYEHQSELGAVLRIELPQGAGCEVLIAENSWTGEILSGDALGCDFLIRLG